MFSDAPSYEDELTAEITAWLARLTAASKPFTEGVVYGRVEIDGAYPSGALLVRFEQSEHPGQQFGLRLSLADWAAPDAIDLRTGSPDPLPASDVAELIGIHLDQHLEPRYFAPPERPADKDGVIWLKLDRDGYV